MRVQVLKTLNPKLSIGKYSILQILLFTFFAFVILFAEFMPFIWRLFLLYSIFKLSEMYKHVKGRSCRAYKTHYLYWFGLKSVNTFPKAKIREFGG